MRRHSQMRDARVVIDAAQKEGTFFHIFSAQKRLDEMHPISPLGGILVNRHFLASACVLALTIGAFTAAHSDELSSAYELVLSNPTDAAKNLQYAKLAEEKGKPRLALAAYERILLNDPENAEARLGLQRLRRVLQPSSTEFKLEVGTAWESNPDNVSSNEKSAPSVFANLAVRDERSAGTFGWRTLGSVGVDYVNNHSDLNYEHISVGTGPVFDVTPGLSVHTAVGVAATNLSNKLYYREANLTATFEGNFAGAYESLRIRGGARSYGSYFTPDNGYYAEARGRVAIPAVLAETDVISFGPWLKWSGIDGSVTDISQEEIQPGRYREWGAELSYYIPVADSIIAGPNLTGWQRYYSEHLVGGDTRTDNHLEPGASLVFKDALMFQSDVKLDYTYQMNRSNDDTRDYHDNEVRLTVIANF